MYRLASNCSILKLRPQPVPHFLQAGGCYLPLDPSYPDDRLAIYMEDASAAVLLTQDKHTERAKRLGGANASWKVSVQC